MDITSQEFTDLLQITFNIMESEIFLTIETFYKSIQQETQLARLYEMRYRGIGTHRLLWKLMCDHLEGSPYNLAKFYFEISTPDQEWHFEEILASILSQIIIGIILEVIGSMVYDYLKRKNPQIKAKFSELKERISQFLQEAKISLRYALTLFWIRGKIYLDNHVNPKLILLLKKVKKEFCQLVNPLNNTKIQTFENQSINVKEVLSPLPDQFQLPAKGFEDKIEQILSEFIKDQKIVDQIKDKLQKNLEKS